MSDDSARLQWMKQNLQRFPSSQFAPGEARAVFDWCRRTCTEVWRVPENSLLRHLEPAPEYLFVQGNSDRLAERCLSVVGTRRPSDRGLAAAFRFGHALGESGLVVVSGLALGVDSAAHRGALAANGFTVAVLGHGLDRIYPSVNRELAQSILRRGGCLVSEYAPGVPPLRPYFPLRNRIIAALSELTIVIEAAKRSGSLITAQYALDLGRELAVLPGRFDDVAYEGGHRLIQDGAALVLEPEEIFLHLGLKTPPTDQGNEQRALRQLFTQPIMTLPDLFSQSHDTLAELIGKLERARACGWVGETGHETYVWIAPENRELEK
jgi:DNA processing protein